MSRTDARSNALRHRPARTIPASVVALILLGLGLGLAWVAVLKLSQGSWPAFLLTLGDSLGRLTWGAGATIAVSAVIAVIGLVLLIAALTPGQPNALRLVDPHDMSESQVGDTDYVMTRRSVAKLAAAHADLVDGVDSVTATASARRVDLRVRTASDQRGEIERQVLDRVRGALEGAGITPIPRVIATVRTRL